LWCLVAQDVDQERQQSSHGGDVRDSPGSDVLDPPEQPSGWTRVHVEVQDEGAVGW
jgi:hypothetical protein